jgi:hypothetical protein
MVYCLLGLYALSDIDTGVRKQGQLYRLTETESCLQNVVFLNKNRTMDNVQKHNICFNALSSQTFKFCEHIEPLVDQSVSIRGFNKTPKHSFQTERVCTTIKHLT